MRFSTGFRAVFSRLSVYFRVKTRSAQKLQNLVGKSFGLTKEYRIQIEGVHHASFLHGPRAERSTRRMPMDLECGRMTTPASEGY